MIRMAASVTAENGTVRATLVGNPETFGEGQTREAAMEALHAEVERMVRQREVRWTVFNDPPRGLLALAGSSRHDEDLDGIVAEAYTRRDAEKLAEFPE